MDYFILAFIGLGWCGSSFTYDLFWLFGLYFRTYSFIKDYLWSHVHHFHCYWIILYSRSSYCDWNWNHLWSFIYIGVEEWIRELMRHKNEMRRKMMNMYRQSKMNLNAMMKVISGNQRGNENDCPNIWLSIRYIWLHIYYWSMIAFYICSLVWKWIVGSIDDMMSWGLWSYGELLTLWWIGWFSRSHLILY